MYYIWRDVYEHICLRHFYVYGHTCLDIYVMDIFFLDIFMCMDIFVWDIYVMDIFLRH
jgi:hypothetical protein